MSERPSSSRSSKKRNRKSEHRREDDDDVCTASGEESDEANKNDCCRMSQEGNVESSKDQSLSDSEYIPSSKCPFGYVGWMKDVDSDFNMKLYISNLPDTLFDDNYMDFMEKFAVNYLILRPKNPSETLLTVLFAEKGRSFSHYFNHERFVLNEVNTGYTLLEVFNYVPKSDISKMFEDVFEQNLRINHYDRMVYNFISSYKAFQSGRMGINEPGYGNEQRDVDMLIRLSLAFGPGMVSAFREVGISCKTGEGPHGYIDLMVYAEDKGGTFIAIKDLDSMQMGGVKDMSVGKLTATSAKTANTFSEKGSDRQCVVELLALSEVVLRLNSDCKVVTLLKACKERFQLYIYFTERDLLIRTDEVPFFKQHGTEPSSRMNEVMGFFAFYLVMNLHLNTTFQDFFVYEKCGWKEAFIKSGCRYDSWLSPQRIDRPKGKANKVIVQDLPRKKMKTDVPYPPVEF